MDKLDEILKQLANKEIDPEVAFQSISPAAHSIKQEIIQNKDSEYNQKEMTKKQDISVSNQNSIELLKEKAITFLTTEIAKKLSLDQTDIDLQANFLDMGLDSVTLITFSEEIENEFNIKLYPTVFFEHQNLTQFSSYLIDSFKKELLKYFAGENIVEKKSEGERQIVEEKEKQLKEVLSVEDNQTSGFSDNLKQYSKSTTDIAIVGMSGKFPDANVLETFWKNLKEKKHAIGEIPKERWNWKKYEKDLNANTVKGIKWGGFIADIDKFDSLFFGISPKEAELMDPQQRLFLEAVWQTIEDAGYSPSSLSDTQTGLFVGVATSDYAELMVENHTGVEAYTSIGTEHSVLANRISYLLNIHGPSEPIDTACSSSLIAIHRAIEAIQNGDCDKAIVGGVSAIITPRLHISFGKAGMLCEDGRCKTFDKRANGYVRGEGVGAIFLKPLSQAIQDGDHIYAVIKGSAENHGGHANSLTAPNPNAQAEVIVKAYERAKIDPSTVGYIEAHGTGTELGDPVEINGLKKAFNELYNKWGKTLPKSAHCGLGSVKTNIGHLETAAGIAGIIKVLLMMKHKKIPGVVHFKELNPYIDLRRSPFYIASETKDWEAIRDEKGNELPRRAGVSSFGFGGANAHVVLEEYRQEKVVPEVKEDTPQIIILSAKNEDRLREYAQKMVEWLDKTGKREVRTKIDGDKIYA
ncbi:beta-ketoacyl synthase N-terminal-like domain-containing protein, partial [Chlamydiota bacterium]